MPARVTLSALAIAAPVHRRNKDIKISLCGTSGSCFCSRTGSAPRTTPAWARWSGVKRNPVPAAAMQEQYRLDLETPGRIPSLRELAKAENECRRCPLYRNATQAVPGEGRRHAHLMLVGEQPGDKEDIAGKPFVGPAGRILDLALAEAGIPRAEVFVTNAVKHFKHEV